MMIHFENAFTAFSAMMSSFRSDKSAEDAMEFRCPDGVDVR
jgi:hypothetical protein